MNIQGLFRSIHISVKDIWITLEKIPVFRAFIRRGQVVRLTVKENTKHNGKLTNKLKFARSKKGLEYNKL